MDNLPAHKPARVRELIEERGCQLVYLPSYSPDFNPTLKKRSARSKVWCAKRELARGKHWLRYWAKHFRRSASRTLEAISSMLAIVHKPNYCETCCRCGAMGRFWPYRTVAMQDPVSELPRIPLLRTPLNRVSMRVATARLSAPLANNGSSVSE